MTKLSIGSLVQKVFGSALGFINGIVFARLLGPKEFGTLTLVMAFITLGSTIAALGMPLLVTREVSKSKRLEQWGLMRTLILKSHSWGLMSSVALMVSIWVARFSGMFDSISSLTVGTLIAGMLIVLINVLNQIRAAILRGLSHVIVADVPELIIRPVSVMMILGMVYLLYDHADAYGGILVYLVAAGISFVVGARLLKKYIEPAIFNSDLVHGNHSWLVEVQEFFWITFLAILDVQLAIYFVGYFLGAQQAGIYQVALMPVSAIMMGLAAVNVQLQPKLSAAWASNNKPEAQRLIDDSNRISSIVAVIIAIPVFLFANLVIGLYGKQFIDAIILLQILVAGQVINALTGQSGMILMMTGNQRILLYFELSFLIVKALIVFCGIHWFGLLGVAIAEVSYLILMKSLAIIYIHRYTGLKTSVWRLHRNST